MERWKSKILELKDFFRYLHIKNIYGYFNEQEDALSKQALLLEEGKIYIVEYSKNIIISKSSISVFKKRGELFKFLVLFVRNYAIGFSLEFLGVKNQVCSLFLSGKNNFVLSL